MFCFCLNAGSDDNGKTTTTVYGQNTKGNPTFPLNEKRPTHESAVIWSTQGNRPPLNLLRNGNCGGDERLAGRKLSVTLLTTNHQVETFFSDNPITETELTECQEFPVPSVQKRRRLVIYFKARPHQQIHVGSPIRWRSRSGP
ncbi:hypothetical protein BV898_12540 [Hypsibius exemplaris]|uniref:Uncharacterized protein n=1 Tax=Hypsibius exemplaris TaxID=2072580 RepID=A0A1W0WDC0_HYPEX|nr:hypothetical protein BV898_12540 [Hypsibius exemplaris]